MRKQNELITSCINRNDEEILIILKMREKKQNIVDTHLSNINITMLPKVVQKNTPMKKTVINFILRKSEIQIDFKLL